MGRQQVFIINVSHCSEYVAFNLAIASIKLLKHGFYFLALGNSCRGTGIDEIREVLFYCKTPGDIFVDKGQRSYHREFTLEKILGRDHCTDFSGIEDIQK